MLVLITPVMNKNEEYSQHLMNISIDRAELQNILEKNFENVTEISKDYFDDNGIRLTFVLS